MFLHVLLAEKRTIPGDSGQLLPGGRPLIYAGRILIDHSVAGKRMYYPSMFVCLSIN